MFAIQTFLASLVCLSVFVVGGILLVFEKVFGFFVYVFRFCPWWVVKFLGEISFSFKGFFFQFFLYGPQVDPSSSLSFVICL